jgi:LysR substrate binding domain
VARAGQVLAPARALDLATLRRTFTVQGHDALIGALYPALLDTAIAEAPGVSLRFLPEPSVDTPDLARGHVDIEVGATVPATAEISHEVVGHDELVAVFRPEHPLATRFTLERFAAANHAVVSRRGRLRDGVDKVLAERAYGAGWSRPCRRARWPCRSPRAATRWWSWRATPAPGCARTSDCVRTSWTWTCRWRRSCWRGRAGMTPTRRIRGCVATAAPRWPDVIA